MARITGTEVLTTSAGTLRLRQERPADAEFCFTLFRSARPLEAQLAHLPPDLRATLMRGQFLAQAAGHQAQHPGATPWLLELDGAPVGRLLLDESGPAWHVVDLALLPAWRGQGVGTALLRHLRQQAQQAGAKLKLAVTAENLAAQRLYLRLGWRPAGGDGVYLFMEA